MTDQVGIIKKAAKAAGVYDQILRIVDSDIQWVGAPVDLSAFIALQVRSMLLLQTKAEANKRILDRMPDFKQRNYIAFEIALLTDVEAGVFDVENHIKWNV